MFPTVFIIPVVAMLIPIVAIIGGIWTKINSDRLRADQRMAMLARGHSLAEIDAALRSRGGHDCDAPAKDPMRSLGNARRTAVVLISLGVGTILFFLAVDAVLQTRGALAGAATGLPLLILGLGFVVDYQLQKRELSRFGLEIDPGSDSDPRS